MLESPTSSPWALAMPGVVAGLVGGVLIDAYLIVTLVLATHTVGLAAFFQFTAAGTIGPAAYTQPSSVYLGIALHFLVSIAWGVGYAFVAARTPQVLARPLLSGIAFGVVVMLAMQLVEVAANLYRLPTTFSLFNAFVAHIAFFGIPVAYIVTTMLERSHPSPHRG